MKDPISFAVPLNSFSSRNDAVTLRYLIYRKPEHSLILHERTLIQLR